MARRWMRAAGAGRSLSPAVLLAAALLAALAGCDWLKASGPGTRVTPFLSDLRVSPPSVLCDQKVEVIFDYDDPQDDISLLTVTFQHTTSQAIRERQVDWESAGDLNLRVGGRATLNHRFACTDRGGRWTVTVQVEDLRGHLSNTLTGEINLTLAG